MPLVPLATESLKLAATKLFAIAQSPAGKAAAQELIRVVVKTAKGGRDEKKRQREQEQARAAAEREAEKDRAARERQAERERLAHVEEAIEHARSVGGQYSRDWEVAHRVRQLVLKDSTVIFAYPALTEEELAGKPLAERQQFANFPSHRMKEPPSPPDEPLKDP